MAKSEAEKKQPSPSERESVSSQERLRLFMECAKDYAIVMLDPDGRVTEWDAGAEGVFGYPEQEAVGQPFTLFFPPEERDRPQDGLRKAAADGRSEDERWHVRKDGTRFWADSITTALRDEDKNLVGFVKVVLDRTARKEMEDHLRRVEERFRLFMENVKEYAVFMLDLEGRVVDWNLGRGTRPRLQRRDPGDAVLGLLSAGRLRQGRAGARAAGRGRHRPGQRRPLARAEGRHLLLALGITTAMRDENGSLKGFTKVLRDSTERKHFEEELQKRNEALEEADRRKDEFLAVLAHELRNPLAPMFNALSILEQGNLPAETARHTRLLIDRQVRQLTRLVDDLLDVCRITRGKIQLRKKPVELKVVLDNAVQACRPLLTSHKHELTMSLPPDPIWLDADQTRMEQVVVNMLNNSAKYSQDGGRITIEAGREREEVVLRIRDTGMGIAPELLPHIFELFTQADRTLDRSQGGLGIGLTLVRKLVELHDGRVEAYSEGVGKGSEFVVRVPVLKELPRSAAPESTLQAPRPSENALRVLIVEDEADSAEALEMILTMMGHQVQTAHSGMAALQAAKDHRPDVILLDIGLPGLNGYQVAERLRETPDAMKHVVLVAMTGYGQPEDRQRAVRAGFDYHMVKPVDPRQLEQLLTQIAKPKGV